jgi:predicted dehydrogenase
VPGKLRVGLIGCGYISFQHGPAWRASEDAELVAVCDQDEGRAGARAAEWGVGAVYRDAAEMIERERLDAIDVVTRPQTHTALVGLGASRGVHLLCQKPLAPTLDGARAMVETCERAGVRFMVAEMWRHLPWWRDLRGQVEAGAIGEPYHLRVVGARRAMRREAPVNENQPYFAAMPKLIVYEMMIHWIDPARYVLGEVETVYARMRRVNPAIVGEDWALVVLTHAGRATSQLDGSWANDAEPPGATREGDVVLEGTEGVLHFAPHERELRVVKLGGETSVLARYPEMAESFQRAFDGCIGDFANAVRTGRAFESSAEDNLKTLGATFAAYESARTGEVVRAESM